MATSAVVHGGIGLRVPGMLEYRHLVIRLVSTACKMALEGVRPRRGPHGRDEFEAEVISASGEAFNNIAIHGYRGRRPGPVSIDVAWDEERLSITFVDEGRVFDPRTAAPPNLDDLPERGMGLYIMRTCMDEVHYRPGPPNLLRLMKRLVPRVSHAVDGTEGT